MDSSIKISFLGDISLNDAYIDLYEQGIDPFLEIKPILKANDLVVGNLECMAKGDFGENELKRPRLTTHVETLNFLNNLNVKAVSLAQNHIYDHLEDGYKKTIAFLEGNKIKYLGAGKSKKRASEPLIISQNGLKIGLLNYVTNDTHPNLPLDAKVHLNFFEEDLVIRNIKELKSKVDHAIVLLHWGGNVGGGYFPDFNQPQIARRLVDAGADLIIGHHSHSLQPYEIYRNKYIFYSIGNFCFSDIIFENKTIEIYRGKNTRSIIVSVSFKKEDYAIKIASIENKSNFIIENHSLLKKLNTRNYFFKIINRHYFIWRLYYFKLKKIDPVLSYFLSNGRNPIKQMRILIKKKLINI